MKIFFGYAKHSSVTKMLFELRLPSFHTVLMNGRSVFRCMWEKCNNSIVQFLCSMSLVVVFPCFVCFCAILLTYFSTVLCLSVCAFYGHCRLK